MFEATGDGGGAGQTRTQVATDGATRQRREAKPESEGARKRRSFLL
jgi:hypothetical protein